MLALMLFALAVGVPEQAVTVTVPEEYFQRSTNARILNFPGLITHDDYPEEAVAKEEQGTAEVVLTVNEQGKLANCIVAVSSGSNALDAQSCRIFWQRGQFEVARDRQDKPVIGAIRQRIAWRMEESLKLAQPQSVITSDDYPLVAVLLGIEGTVGVQMKVDPSGRVTDCAVQQSSGFTILDSQTCRIFKDRARFERARDSLGRPVAATTTNRITWRIADNNLPIIPWAFRLGVLLGADGVQTKCSLAVGGALKRKLDTMVLPCSDLGGGFAVPSDLARTMLGKKTILVFDRQFVPRTVPSIDTPPDLKRFTLLGREVISLKIGGDGTVIECRKKAAEGLFLPNPSACDTLGRRQFTKPAKARSPLTATATVSVYSQRVH